MAFMSYVVNYDCWYYCVKACKKLGQDALELYPSCEEKKFKQMDYLLLAEVPVGPLIGLHVVNYDYNKYSYICQWIGFQTLAVRINSFNV